MSVTVIFDLFHTLVSPEAHWPAGFSRERAAAEALGVDADLLTRFWEGFGQDRYAGRSVVELLEAVAESQGKTLTAEDLRSALEVYGRYHDRALTSPRPDVIGGLRTLRERGCRLAVLSNADDREVAAWDRSPLSELIPTACFSYAIGFTKPDPEAYRAVLRRLSADPPSVVFVGDGGSGEFDGAREVGIGRIICVTGFGTPGGLRSSQAIDEASILADVVVPTVAELPSVLLG
jgi:putative hydrolase of the HAD superfamily